MSIEVDAGGIERAQMLLAGIPQAADKAVANSLNRSIVAARTAISKGIRGEYVVSAGDVKKNIRLDRAKPGKLSASVTFKGAFLELTKFKVKSRKGRGIQAQIKRGRSFNLPHSFFVATGHAGTYHRSSKASYPIDLEFGPSVPQMAGNAKVTEPAILRAQDVFSRTLEHEIFARLEGYV